MQFFEERLHLWEYLKTANVAGLDSLLSTLLVDFVELYKKYSKGKDKYTKLLLSWYEYMKQHTVKGNEKGEAVWSELIICWSDPDSIAENTKSCLMSSLLKGSMSELLKRVECCLSNSPEHEPPSWFPSAEGYKADDEVNQYRLAGFALFSCIRFRNRKLMWRRKLGVSKETAQRYRTEHAILQQLRDVDKCDLPPAIHIQDRGGMTFINPTLIPFVKNAVGEIRLLLNYQEYSKQGKQFFKNVKEQLPMARLQHDFNQSIEPLVAGADDALIASLGEELVLKMRHTMSNDFLRNVATLENLKDKGVGIQMGLRDELKGYALHTE